MDLKIYLQLEKNVLKFIEANEPYEARKIIWYKLHDKKNFEVPVPEFDKFCEDIKGGEWYLWEKEP